MGGGVDVRCGGFVKRTHGGMGQQGRPWWSCDVGKCSGMVDRWRTNVAGFGFLVPKAVGWMRSQVMSTGFGDAVGVWTDELMMMMP